jgi:hypothetical protein
MRGLVAAILGLMALDAQASAIWGSWYGINQGQAQGTVVFSFFPNGEYFLNDHGNPALDPNGHPGIERGTYTWNETTGAFSFTTLVNGDGEWGLSDGGPGQITIAGDTLTAAGPDGGVLTRVADPNSAIVRGWFGRDEPNPGDLTVLDFLPNGTYLLGGDPPSTSFLEFGSYSWNPVTGAFQFHVIDTTDPEQGFNGSTISSVMVNGSTIVINSSDGVLTGHDVAAAVPESETYALMLAGIGLIGAIARRRGRARTQDS